jgi:hypothetical protein
MSDAEVPTKRWLDGGDEVLPELREGLRGCLEDGPSHAQTTRMRESVSQALTSAGPAKGSPLLKLAALLGAVALGLGTLWWWSARSGEPRQPPAARAPRAVAPPDAPFAPRVNVASTPAQPVAPFPAKTSPGVRGETPKRASALAAPLRTDPAGELAMLTRARRALGSLPVRTLELAAEHARTYGEGTFAQERELLAIEALIRLQRVDEARAKAARFAVRYPGSAHLTRLDVLVGRR